MTSAGLAAEVLDLCRQKGIRLAVAESCTGGLVCAALTAVPGASDVLECGYVTYSNQAKKQMLGVPLLLIRQHGAVSEPVALAMAAGALRKSAAGLAVATTGIAGPGGSEKKPEGMVCFAVAATGRKPAAMTLHYGAIGRAKVRERSVIQALELLLAAAGA